MVGADVYLERPVHIKELAARRRALNRRYVRDVEADGYFRASGEGQLGKIFEQLSKTEDLVVPVPKVDLPTAPVLHTVVLQLMSYYCALERGCAIDRPRNPAKSVTVP